MNAATTAGSAAPHTAWGFIHPDNMPDLYALTGVGTCMLPLIDDGACVAFDKRLPVKSGDIVCVIFSARAAAAYGAPGLLKRFVSMPPEGFDGMIVVEQVNPVRRYTIPSTDVLAIHKMIGIAAREGNGKATVRLPKGGEA